MIHKSLKVLGEGILIALKRLKLKNKRFTLLANNCNGGIIYHSLGEKFNSPTINLFIRTEDYFRMLENLDEVLVTDIHEITTDKLGESPLYPLGEINLKSGDTIQIHFVHYQSFEEARNKWIERCTRVDKTNIFVLMELGIETTNELVERFDHLPFKHKAIITNKEYPDFKSAIHIDIYGPDFKWGTMVRLIPGTLHRHIELFDYIHWLNTGIIKHAKFYKKYLQQHS